MAIARPPSWAEVHASLRDLVGGVSGLAARAPLRRRLCRLFNKGDVTLRRVGDLIASDLGLSLKVIQVANTDFLRPGETILRPKDAVVRLGLRLAREIVAQSEMFPADEIDCYSHLRLYDHSQRVARLTRELVGDTEFASEAFAAGMFHDVGKSVIAVVSPRRVAEICRLARESDKPLHVHEESAFGVSHADIGAYLLGLAGVPYRIVEAIACHHTPERAVDDATGIVSALHVANAVVHREFPELKPEQTGTSLDEVQLSAVKGLAPPAAVFARILAVA